MASMTAPCCTSDTSNDCENSNHLGRSATTTTEQDYNNAGVVYMRAGYFQAAWDLFKGALELHLARERQSKDNKNRSEAGSHHNHIPPLSPQRQAFIRKAERRFLELVAMHEASSGSTPPPPTARTNSNPENTNSATTNSTLEEDWGPDFFLFTDPLEIPTNLPDESSAWPYTGLIVILNLALLQQRQDPSSPQVVALYRLASSLLLPTSTSDTTEEVVLPLKILIANNSAVWYVCNGHLSVAERCMERLANMCQRHASLTPGTKSRLLGTRRVQQGLQYNLDWFTTPRYKISPAA